MFENLKTFFTGVQYVWKYSATLTSIMKYVSTYPGVGDSELLREWVRPVILDLSVLTSMTKNTIDDVVSRTAVHIIDNDKAWNAVHSLLLLTNDNNSDGAVKIPMGEQRNKVAEAYYDVTDSIQVENPAVIIAAIGLIIQLIQLLRKK